MKRIYSTVRGCSSCKQLAFSMNPNLPFGIVLEISRQLSVPDQVCFSLSCKYLYEAFRYLLGTKPVQISHICPPESRPVLCINTNIEQRPRVQLLRQLEDSRWKFCDECWLLHPRVKRKAHRLTLRDKFRGFIVFPSPKLLENTDFQHSGMIEICPCLTITFSDKLRLIDEIEKLEKRDPHKNNQDPPKLPTQWPYDLSHGRLRHRCTFTDHPFAHLEVVTQLWNEGPYLLATSNYEFQMGENISSRDMPSGLRNPFVFPEEDVRSWLESFFYEAGSKFSGWPKDHNTTLSKHGRPMRLGIQTFRNLGDRDFPNQNWLDHCC